MKRKASISHDKAIVRELREDPEFASEYLKAALEESDEPQVLLIALRHLAEAKGGLAKVAKAAGIERKACTVRCRQKAILGFQRLWPSPKPSDSS